MLLREFPPWFVSSGNFALRHRDRLGLFVDFEAILDSINTTHRPNGAAEPFYISASNRARQRHSSGRYPYIKRRHIRGDTANRFPHPVLERGAGCFSTQEPSALRNDTTTPIHQVASGDTSRVSDHMGNVNRLVPDDCSSAASSQGVE
ncbi:MAG TPA: hypothetical protein VM282_27990 [Acidimicrobiales bacterium]|nr:hypothetical protein [Acidimicrobiales bacterium]